MAVAYVNGHSRPPIDPNQLKLPLDPEPDRVVLCAVRLGYGSWCCLPDKHEGDHEGGRPIYGPVEERPALWRRHRGWEPK